MQPVLTAAQMREVDRLTNVEYGIPSIILMENAANAVARVISEKLGGSVKKKQILILCGPGNNGGDGAALARILSLAGARVEAVLFGKVEATKGDARKNFEKLLKMGSEGSCEFVELGDRTNSRYDFPEKVHSADVVVDAIFGTGLTRDLDRGFCDALLAIARANTASEPKPLTVAVDIPSGIDSDSTEQHGPPITADVTVTFTAPKAGNVLAGSAHFNGELIVADIGSPPELIDAQKTQLFLATAGDAQHWLSETKFSHDSYKNKRGHTLVIAGSEEFSGAAVLSGNAAMRSGVGLVTVVTPSSSKDSVVARLLPEVMVRGVSETENGAIAEVAFDEIGDLLDKADSVAIGCGLSQSESTRRFVKKVVAERHQPVVVDADALNLLSPFSANWPPAHVGGSDYWPPAHAGGSDLIRTNWPPAHAGGSDYLPPAHAGGSDCSPLILTPHEGEFLRLIGEAKTDPNAMKDAASPILRNEGSQIEDRVAAVREFATKHKVILVLKGERVLTGAPDGRVVVNPTGNSGLGKAGNGDTLTGILAGFTAQAAKMNIDIFETVVAAVYVAGMAGDIAEKKYGKRVMTASDVRECLTDAFESLRSTE